MTHRFKTVRELICWEYAKLIAGSAVDDRAEFRFVQYTYQQLMHGKVNPTTILRENQLLFAAGERCIYCGSTHQLEWDHVVPRARGGPDIFDNLVRACRLCNRAKGARDPYQWQVDGDIDNIPRVALGKLLKLCFDAYEQAGLLDDADHMSRHQITRASLTNLFTNPRRSGHV